MTRPGNPHTPRFRLLPFHLPSRLPARILPARIPPARLPAPFPARLLPLLIIAALTTASRGELTIDWSRVVNGGIMDSPGGTLTLSGTIGQWDAGMLAGGGLTLAGGFWGGAPGCQTGDMNCDGAVNALDINPFVKAITNPAAYFASFPGCDIQNADCNYDGAINALDINPFVRLLTGP